MRLPQSQSRPAGDSFAKVHAALKLVTKIKTEMGRQLPLLRLHRPIDRDNFQPLETAFDQALAGGCNKLTIALSTR